MEKEKRELLQKANVVGFGKGYKAVHGKETSVKATSVFVSRKVPEHLLRARDIIPQSAFGRPTDVIETGEIIAFSNTDRMRPIQPGYSIGHYLITAGTFGAVVYKNGEPMILSNNHVLANCNDAEIGDRILQPGGHDGGDLRDDVVAHLYGYETIRIMAASCPFVIAVEQILNTLAGVAGSSHRFKAYDEDYGKTNKVDAALACPTVEMSPHIIEIGTPAEPIDAHLSMDVHKSGRTTSYTRGKVSQMYATVKVRYPGGFAVFEDQIVVSGSNPFSQPGDSGSLILSGVNPVALLFAGSNQITIGNPIAEVMNALGVSFQ